MMQNVIDIIQTLWSGYWLLRQLHEQMMVLRLQIKADEWGNFIHKITIVS